MLAHAYIIMCVLLEGPGGETPWLTLLCASCRWYNGPVPVAGVAVSSGPCNVIKRRASSVSLLLVMGGTKPDVHAIAYAALRGCPHIMLPQGPIGRSVQLVRQNP